MRMQGAAALWSGDSGADVELSHAYGFGCSSPEDDDGSQLLPTMHPDGRAGCVIPCMAGELLQHILANEQGQLAQPWCVAGRAASPGACGASLGHARDVDWECMPSVHAC